MKQSIRAAAILFFALAVAACAGRESVSITPIPSDTLGPDITRILISSKSFSRDCVPTFITVTATITDGSSLRGAVLWYRLENDTSYTQKGMEHIDGNEYSASVAALDLPVGNYGVWEFYIAATDALGNLSESQPDRRVELLACVAN